MNEHLVLPQSNSPSTQADCRAVCHTDGGHSSQVCNRPVESQLRASSSFSSPPVLQHLPAAAASLSLTCDLFMAGTGKERSKVSERKMSSHQAMGRGGRKEKFTVSSEGM